MHLERGNLNVHKLLETREFSPWNNNPFVTGSLTLNIKFNMYKMYISKMLEKLIFFLFNFMFFNLF